jgi:hypothetical protein
MTGLSTLLRPIRIAQPRTRVGDDDRAVPIGLLIDGNLIKEPIAQEMIFPPVRIFGCNARAAPSEHC